ncbi:MAG TPA: sigma-70 family RNA polymerase sigma factor [Urbifossiella sp.]|nr:sigma-70 family RNA polymerase sigma factor [Urbifossiella sp.]
MCAVSTRPTRSPFESYLTEIDRTPLLTRDEEHGLAHRIADGNVEARDQLARANLRLVVSIARRYTGRGLSIEDLIAEGNVGLLRAVEGFDAAAGTRFSTYAAYWVKQSLRVALNRYGHSVRLPMYMGVLLPKWRRAEATLRDTLGRDPLPTEVASELGLKRGQVRAVAKALKAVGSARATGGEEDGNAVLADVHAAAPADRLDTADDVQAALAALDQLGEREATVLRLRFGLDGGEPMTLEAVGRRFGLTRERARQIERSALTALRATLAA